MRCTDRPAYLTALAVLVAVLTLSACSPLRLVEAVDVLEDVAAGPGSSSLKQSTPPPERTSVTIAPFRSRAEATTLEADLYEPAEPARAGMVLVPGATPAGRNDPRVVAFAETLARARFRVLVPDLPGLRTFRFGSGDAVHIAAAVRDLADRNGDLPLGLTAVSFAVGGAVLALEETNSVDFAVLIGGYHDITDAITYVTTGYFRTAPDSPWQKGSPTGLAKWAFVRSNVHRLTSEADRDALSAIAEAKMAEAGMPDAGAATTTDAAPSVDDEVPSLGPEGQSVLALMETRDPDRIPERIAALPPAIQAEIADLDLSLKDLSQFDASFVIIHGRDDPVLPASGSVALAGALPNADLYIVDALRHVEASAPGFGDGLTLLRATHRVLMLRDGW